MAEQYISVGKLGKPHKLSGAFRFYFYNALRNKKKFPKNFLLYVRGSFLPFFVKSNKWKSNTEGFIAFEEIITPEMARNYSGSEIYLMQDEAKKYFGTDEDYLALIGYKIIGEDDEQIGTITELYENPANVLASVKINGREVLIPLAEEFILKKDSKKKTLKVSLPEGLLEL